MTASTLGRMTMPKHELLNIIQSKCVCVVRSVVSTASRPWPLVVFRLNAIASVCMFVASVAGAARKFRMSESSICLIPVRAKKNARGFAACPRSMSPPCPLRSMLLHLRTLPKAGTGIFFARGSSTQAAPLPNIERWGCGGCGFEVVWPRAFFSHGPDSDASRHPGNCSCFGILRGSSAQVLSSGARPRIQTW